jgi:tRNA nucleotidyltransferase (CCA-adding enzyme)
MAVLERLWRSGHAAYLVGGGVRDALLGLAGADWDVATDARPERILQVFPGSTYQNRFGTVLARGLEITTFRRDHRYADHRRPDNVTFSDDIYEDLARRDLTINAIAWGRRSLETAARLVDPADGQGDLRAGLVRAVGDPNRRFDEDALRLLRAVRIAARLDFTIEPVTRAAMVAHAADIVWVSEERIGSEVRRMLEMDQPSRAFVLLNETSILATTLPELRPPGASNEPGEGPGSDRFARMLRTLDAAAAADPGNERLALAALLSETDTVTARRILGRLRISARESDAVCALVEAVPAAYAPDWSDVVLRRFMARLPAQLLDDLLALRRARAQALDEAAVGSEDELAARLRAQRSAQAPLTLAALAIDGRDLRDTLGIPEGPLIGAILERLLEDVIEDPSLNRRLTLLTRAGLVLNELVEGAYDGSDPARME